MATREQKEGEGVLQYASDLRKMAILAYPCTDPKHSDDTRGDRCLDVFMNGLRDELVSVYNQNPEALEDAISAAEAYAAILSTKQLSHDPPTHPDLLSPKETTQAAVYPRAGDAKPQKGRQKGQKNFPKKDFQKKEFQKKEFPKWKPSPGRSKGQKGERRERLRGITATLV
jgi:hypothetical protein